MKNKIFIVIEREYVTRITKKSFILLTILMPFLMAALVALPMILGSVKGNEQQVIAIVDNTHHYAPAFKSTEQYHFCVEPSMTDSLRNADAAPTAVVLITDDLVAHPEAATIYSHEEIQMDLRQTVERILADQIREDKLAAYNIPQLTAIIDDVQADFSISTIKWADDGSESRSSTDIAMIIGMLFTMLIYMFVMSYGGMVMSGVMEEKTSRIIEVMVSSVSPFQLMMGKIIGVLLVGLTQILIWGVMLGGIALAIAGLTDPEVLTETSITNTSALATAGVPADLDTGFFHFMSGIPAVEILVMFVLCFLGGYMLYASIFAACGAAVNSQEDSSQFMMPIILLMVFSLYAALGSMENTNGPLAMWTSFIPFTSPIVMMLRIPFGIPLWQEVLSIGLLFATATIFIWISARIYRVGILMHGKKPTLKEMWRWVRYN